MPPLADRAGDERFQRAASGLGSLGLRPTGPSANRAGDRAVSARGAPGRDRQAKRASLRVVSRQIVC
jgi:hypothetical protein